MKKEKPKQGFSIHPHHDILVEYCYDYDERVKSIKRDKPKNEKKTRLKLFKPLPKEAVKEIPREWREADRRRQKARQKQQEADQKRRKAYQKWRKTDQKRWKTEKWWETYHRWQRTDQKWPEINQKWQEIYQKRQKTEQKWWEAYQRWSQKDKDAFHKKWCGCKEWNGEKIVFNK